MNTTERAYADVDGALAALERMVSGPLCGIQVSVVIDELTRAVVEIDRLELSALSSGRREGFPLLRRARQKLEAAISKLTERDLKGATGP